MIKMRRTIRPTLRRICELRHQLHAYRPSGFRRIRFVGTGRQWVSARKAVLCEYALQYAPAVEGRVADHPRFGVQHRES
jgi:hypothetical protein